MLKHKAKRLADAKIKGHQLAIVVEDQRIDLDSKLRGLGS